MSFNIYTPASQRVLIVWLFFHISAQVLLPVLLLTFLLTRVKRHPIFVNMLLSLVVTSVLCTMLWYKHRGFYSPDSEDGDAGRVRFDHVCLAQASVVHHAAPPMVSLSAFSLIFHVWTRVRTTVKPDPPHLAAFITLRTTALLVAPWLAFALFGVASSIITANNMLAEPPMVVLALYCELQHDALGKARAVFTAIVLLVTAIYEVRIILTLRRKSTGDMDSVERALFIRVVLFGAYVLLAFVLSIVSMITNTVASDLYIATVPMVVFFIFACQKDVLTAWAFWKRTDFGHIRRPSLTPLWPKKESV